jgi:ABC-type glycerol-3-phosphate transport system substrate-binding protein
MQTSATKTPRPKPAVEAATLLEVEQDALRDLQIEVWHPWFIGVEASLLESLVEQFNQENEWGIEVTLTGQVNYSYLYENVTTSLPTPRRPDLVIALPEHARTWDEDGYVVDMTPYVNDPLYGLDQEARRDFAAAFWSQDDAGTRRLALPAQRTARFLLWNQSWADELGFNSHPDQPEDLQQQACRAHESMLADAGPENDGLGGWAVDTHAMTALSWLMAFEGGVLEADGYRFLTPNNIEAFGFLKTLQQDGCAWTVPAGGDVIEAFATRQALFATASLETFSDQARAFAAADNTDDWAPLAFPGMDHDALVLYGSSYVTLESTGAEQLASWLFVRWMLQPEIDARWVTATGLFPLRASTLGLLTDYAAGHPQWAQAVDLMTEGRVHPQLSSWRTVKVMLGDGFDCLFRGNPQCAQAPLVLRQMDSISGDLTK